jgi:hypothetical protein
VRETMALAVFVGVGVLGVSLAGKLRSRARLVAFRDGLVELRLVARRRAWVVAVVATSGEGLVLALLVVPGTVLVGLAGASALFAGFAAALRVAVSRGTTSGCHCFGPGSAPVSRRHVVRAAFLCALSLAGTVAGVVAPPGGYLDQSAPALLAVAAGAGLVVLALVLLDDVVWLFAGRTTSRRTAV